MSRRPPPRLGTMEMEVQRKLVLVGFRGVGKSSLCQQFVLGKFVRENEYIPTIEQTFQKTIDLNNVRFNCDLVDTAGKCVCFCGTPTVFVSCR